MSIWLIALIVMSALIGYGLRIAVEEQIGMIRPTEEKEV